jgi:hypothetical protein
VPGVDFDRLRTELAMEPLLSLPGFEPAKLPGGDDRDVAGCMSRGRGVVASSSPQKEQGRGHRYSQNPSRHGCSIDYPDQRRVDYLAHSHLHLQVTGSATTLVVSRLQSSLRAYFALMLRPASWLALLSRTFTFELSLAGSPRANVEYNYVDQQSITTTGLSPASPTALWAA